MPYPIISNIPIRQLEWSSLLPKTNPTTLTERVILVAYILFGGMAAVVFAHVVKRLLRQPNENEVIQDFLMSKKYLNPTLAIPGSKSLLFFPKSAAVDMRKPGITWEVNGQKFQGEKNLVQGYEALGRAAGGEQETQQIFNALQEKTLAYLIQEIRETFNEVVDLAQHDIKISVNNGTVGIVNNLTFYRRKRKGSFVFGKRTVERTIQFLLAELRNSDGIISSLKVSHRYVSVKDFPR